MRVIAGKARRIRLDCIEGLDTRPTTDRIKETLFNMLSGDIYGSVFLDLYAGSGAIGIEALSRGSSRAVFIESSKKALRVINENLKRTSLLDQAHVIGGDCFKRIHELENDHFDIIFMDPPYNKEFEKKMLKILSGLGCADRNTLIIVEASIDTDFGYLNEYGYELIKEKKYKTNKHMFVRKVV